MFALFMGAIFYLAIASARDNADTA